MKTHTIRVLVKKIPLVFAFGSFAVAVQTASAVQAPPLPPGSDLIRVEAGLSPDEVMRHKRAHKHSRLEKKDPTRDDTLDAKDPKDLKDQKTK